MPKSRRGRKPLSTIWERIDSCLPKGLAAEVWKLFEPRRPRLATVTVRASAFAVGLAIIAAISLNGQFNHTLAIRSPNPAGVATRAETGPCTKDVLKTMLATEVSQWKPWCQEQGTTADPLIDILGICGAYRAQGDGQLATQAANYIFSHRLDCLVENPTIDIAFVVAPYAMSR